MSDQPVIRPAELAAGMAARLCHDLISPASAIVSGVDLLDDPEMREDALGLIAASAKKLAAHLEFARVAFGASAAADTFDSRKLKSLADGMFEHARAQLDWAVEAESLQKPAARTAMNLALIGIAALPMGGTASISTLTDDEGLQVALDASGPKARLRPEVAEGLGGQALSEGLPGHWVQAYYLSSLVADAGGALAFEADDAGVRVKVTLPH